MRTLEFRDCSLWLIDQTRLPIETIEIECRNLSQVADAIRRLSVRGAPAIGCAAAYGVVLAAESLADSARGAAFRAGLQEAIQELRSTRPTAVNLFWALDRMRRKAEDLIGESPTAVAVALRAEADAILQEDEDANRSMGQHGVGLIPDGANVLTHCNAGALATGAYGTAVGVIRAAHEQGKQIHVWVDETRPLLQGARLTAWELAQLDIPYTVITDSMAGHFMARGRVDLVITGADRIVANGDTANKIGTYGLAVLARAHQIPLYVAAPLSTIDLETPHGELITIEERNADEVLSFRGVRVAPEGACFSNPAFDVTPSRLISAIVTEKGIARPPYESTLPGLLGSRDVAVIP